MARTYRDAWGIPHVRASSALDLARGQGEVTARDRAWQLEHLRRRAVGETAEVLGEPGMPWDALARRTLIAETAERAYAGLEPETRAFVSAYVEGVNAGLHGDAVELRTLGIAPAPWAPWTPLAVFLAQHLLFASLPGKLWANRVGALLGDDAALLSYEGPHTSGSNAWAVGGRRTMSGLPLVAGDPHRVIEAPGVYQQVRLACEDPDDPFDVVGFAFPGVPGVQHFAHAGSVAWAITNAVGDYQDVFAERLRRVAGRVQALGPSGWEPAESWTENVAVREGEPVEVEVVVTERGPLFEGGVDDGRGLSLRASSTVLGDLGFDALLPLLRARSVDDVDAALDRWVEPVNNVVVADVDGAVRYRVAGRIPLRDGRNRLGVVDAASPDAGWTGWLDPLPRHDVAPDGEVVTANERRGPESDAIGTAFAPPHRADRLHALLDGREDLTAADFGAFHNDTFQASVPPLRGLLAGVEPSVTGAPVRDAILGFDGHMDAGSTAAAAFAAWRSAFVRRIADQDVFAAFREPVLHNPVFAPWLDVTGRIGLALETLVAAGSPYGIDLVELARLALDDAADHPATWGDMHALAAAHAFDVAAGSLVAPPLPEVGVSGDLDCVRCTGSLPGVTDGCYRGSVARYVWDLADRGASGWVVPLGAAGDPADPHHHDQLPLWAAGDLVPVVTDWDLLTEQP
ncbi:MAG: sle [Nocardioides sp.]|nr:sle [Nocardioides sp.]